MIVANENSDTVSVLINTTAAGASMASFAVQQTFATGALPRSVTAGDLDGDGKPDVMVTNYNSTTLSVLVNNTVPGASLARFAVQQTYATGFGPESVTVADVNADGKLDVLVVNYVARTVSVFLNRTARIEAVQDIPTLSPWALLVLATVLGLRTATTITRRNRRN